MTTSPATVTNGQTPKAGNGKTMRGAKKPLRSAARQRTAKPVTKAAAVGSGYSAAASRLLSRGAKAAGGAYDWAVEGAERAAPIAARHMPDHRTVQRLADERPYILGAIGLGIGAMIGLMLPARLMGGTDVPPAPKAKRKSRKS